MEDRSLASEFFIIISILSAHNEKKIFAAMNFWAFVKKESWGGGRWGEWEKIKEWELG